MALGRTNLPTMGGGGPASKPFSDTLKMKAPARPKPVAAPKAPSRKPVRSAPTPFRAPVAVRQAPAPRPVSPAVKATPKPAAPAKPKTPSEPDWLAGDSMYQATLAALQKQLGNFNTDLDTQLGNYQKNFDSSLSDLGYTPGADGSQGAWNFDDPLKASGRAYQNLVNDFAARGMLQSTGYADSQNDLQKSLTDQLTQLNTARDQFTGGLANQRSAFADQNTTAEQQARAESIARRAAKFGLT